jgi:two-component system, cell cycle sensor histidine kinase and response regulator CckA
VYSEPGHGTSFKIYLPRAGEAITPATVALPPPVGGSETVLVVEDVAAVRAVARETLERAGYTVLEAPDGATALRLAEKHHGTIDLLVTDVVMTDVRGPDLAAQLYRLRPGLKVLCMSGYTDYAIARTGILRESVAYLQKPFTPDALVRKVRAVLDESPTPPPPQPPAQA